MMEETTPLEYYRKMKAVEPDRRREVMTADGFTEEQITDYLNYLESETAQGDLRRQ